MEQQAVKSFKEKALKNKIMKTNGHLLVSVSVWEGSLERKCIYEAAVILYCGKNCERTLNNLSHHFYKFVSFIGGDDGGGGIDGQDGVGALVSVIFPKPHKIQNDDRLSQHV